MRLHYQAVARNREPIWEVLRSRLPDTGLVLEVASGSGEHITHFAAANPGLRWQPSDPEADARASVAAWVAHEGLTNVEQPLELDVRVQPWPLTRADAVLCINMIHIAPWDAAQGLLMGAAAVLPAGAPLVLYGPYIINGETADSNRAFDRSLRSRDPRWGVRELRQVEREAAAHGLRLEETVSMPANNTVVVLRREPTP